MCFIEKSHFSDRYNGFAFQGILSFSSLGCFAFRDNAKQFSVYFITKYDTIKPLLQIKEGVLLWMS